MRAVAHPPVPPAYLHLSHFEMKIQRASILHTCFKRRRRRCSCVIWNFTPVPIRQNQHQTAKRYAARKGDFRRNVFDVSSSAADNITHGDLLDCFLTETDSCNSIYANVRQAKVHVSRLSTDKIFD